MTETPVERNGLEISAPGGFRAIATGPFVQLFVMIALGIGIIVTVLYHDIKHEDDAHRRLERNQMALTRAIRVQTWILSLPPDQRPLIKRPVEADDFLHDLEDYESESVKPDPRKRRER